FYTNSNAVQGNFIGSDFGNGGNGVEITQGAFNNSIGGSSTLPNGTSQLTGAGNVISGNGADGVVISDFNTSGNSVQGNLIGLDPTGAMADGNANVGVHLT